MASPKKSTKVFANAGRICDSVDRSHFALEAYILNSLKTVAETRTAAQICRALAASRRHVRIGDDRVVKADRLEIQISLPVNQDSCSWQSWKLRDSGVIATPRIDSLRDRLLQLESSGSCDLRRWHQI